MSETAADGSRNESNMVAQPGEDPTSVGEPGSAAAKKKKAKAQELFVDEDLCETDTKTDDEAGTDPSSTSPVRWIGGGD